MELIGLHHPFHWEFVRFSWFYTYWIIWNGILGILNIVIRLWVMFKSSGDIWVLLFALPANGRKSFRMYILTCLLWAMVLMSVQFLKTLQCSSGLFCESFCFPVWQQGNIYLPQEFIYRRTERKKKHTLEMLPTLFRESLWRQKCSLPRSVPRSHSTTSMGLQPRWGDPVGKWVSPFSLSLSSFPFLRSEWQSFLGVLGLSLSGASFQDPRCLEVQTGSYGRQKRTEGGRKGIHHQIHHAWTYLSLPHYACYHLFFGLFR